MAITSCGGLSPNLNNDGVGQKMENEGGKELTYDFIRGIIVGEGCFSFHTAGHPDERGYKKKIPAFTISLSKQDEKMLYQIKEKLGLHNKIHEYPPYIGKNRHNKQSMMVLVVRDIGQLKNIIVPLCHNKLAGHKADQFRRWIEEIQANPYVPQRYKILNQLSISGGFYDKNPRFIDH